MWNQLVADTTSNDPAKYLETCPLPTVDPSSANSTAEEPREEIPPCFRESYFTLEELLALTDTEKEAMKDTIVADWNALTADEKDNFYAGCAPPVKEGNKRKGNGKLKIDKSDLTDAEVEELQAIQDETKAVTKNRDFLASVDSEIKRDVKKEKKCIKKFFTSDATC